MSDTDQRIRQVAIVLQSLDASTAKSLLGQLPPDMARKVKQGIVLLGTVSAEERQQAMVDLQGLLGNVESPSLKAPASKSATSTFMAQESPAAALLRSGVEQDRLEWSSEAEQRRHASVPFPNESHARQSAITPPSETPWLAWEPSSLANLFAHERPAVIATVLNQLSPERAKKLLDHLPVETAGATLAAIPNLFLVDPTILSDILAEVERKLPKQQPISATANIAGIAKLEAIVNQFQGPQRSAWLNAIAQQNRDVASQLGWSAEAPKKVQAPEIPVEAGSSQSPATYSDPATLYRSQLDTAEAIEEPVILSLHDVVDRFEVSAQSKPIAPKQAEALKSFNDLLELNDGDLVAVLHASDRLDVLRALAGASSMMMRRIERLIPGQDLKRFRSYMKQFPESSSSDSLKSQDEILKCARRLLESGRITISRNVKFAAAA